jgi:hypothetical protein
MSNNSNNDSSMSMMFGQILNGLNRLEQSVMEAAARERARQAGEGEVSTEAENQGFGWHSRSELEEPAYNGPQWEYRVVFVNFKGQISSDGQQVVIERGERRTSFIRKYLNKLGKQGWELTGTNPIDEGQSSYFVFKRLLNPEHASYKPPVTASEHPTAGQPTADLPVSNLSGNHNGTRVPVKTNINTNYNKEPKAIPEIEVVEEIPPAPPKVIKERRPIPKVEFVEDE